MDSCRPPALREDSVVGLGSLPRTHVLGFAHVVLPDSKSGIRIKIEHGSWASHLTHPAARDSRLSPKPTFVKSCFSQGCVGPPP
jgi:hypothetical protein